MDWATLIGTTQKKQPIQGTHRVLIKRYSRQGEADYMEVRMAHETCDNSLAFPDNALDNLPHASVGDKIIADADILVHSYHLT